jgi:hypothetical protein
MFADHAQWRLLKETKFPSRCCLCNDYIEPRKQVYYNGTTKKIKCLNCHHFAPTPSEIWTADVEAEDEENGGYRIERRTIVISTRRRETNPPKTVKLLELIHVIPAEVEWTAAEVRAKYGVRGHWS